LAEDRSLARRTISWVSYAQRPLTSQDLCHALAIELGDIELHGANVYDVEDVISVCVGLVTIDEESNCGFTSVILTRPHVGAECLCILGWWLSIRSYGGGGDYYTGVRRPEAMH
jgi:hypothetical protein